MGPFINNKGGAIMFKKMLIVKTIGNNTVAINPNEISSVEQVDLDKIRIILSNGRFYETKGFVEKFVKDILG